MVTRKKICVTILLCGILLLSGCSFLQGGENTTEPENTTPTTVTPQEETRDSYPEGFSKENVNVSVAVDNHVEALKGENKFRAYEFYRFTQNDTLQQVSTQNWSVDIGNERAFGTADFQNTTQTVYLGDGMAYVKTSTKNTDNNSYSKIPREWNTTRQARSDILTRFLSGVELKYTGEEKQDGESHLHYSITNSSQEQRGNVSLTNISGYVTVSETGYISEIFVTASYSNGYTTHNELRIETDEDISISEPSWTSRATEAP